MQEAPELGALLRSCLPQPWTAQIRWDARRGKLSLCCADAADAEHIFEIQRADGDATAFVQGKFLNFGYRSAGMQVDAALLAIYAQTLQGLAAHEMALLAWLDGSAPKPVAHHTIFAKEPELTRSDVLHPRQTQERIVRQLLGNAPRDHALRLQLFLRGECEQACEFCQVPAHRQPAPPGLRPRVRLAGQQLLARLGWPGIFSALLDELAQWPQPCNVTLLGADWALHPNLEQMLQRLERERRVTVSFTGPTTRLADPDFCKRIAQLPTLEFVVLTVQSPDPEQHDAMVGAPGAGRLLLRAIDNLQQQRVIPGINTVLTEHAVRELGKLLHWIAARRQPGPQALGVQLMWFVPDQGPGDLSPQLVRADRVREVLEQHLDVAQVALRALNRLPLCAVPPQLRAKCQMDGESSARSEAQFPEPCQRCALKPGCFGVNAAYVRRFGAAGLAPEGPDAACGAF